MWKGIVWVKLEKRLLDDHRFYQLSEKAQLLYIKLILLCAKFNNKVSREYRIVRDVLRLPYEESEFNLLLEEIRKSFPKVMLHKDYLFIKGFKEKHNQVSRGLSEGYPKVGTDVDVDVDVDVERRTRKEELAVVVEHFVKIKNYPRESLLNDDWSRFQSNAKKLLLRTGGKTEEAIEAIDWMNGQGYEWSFETVIKKFPDFKLQRYRKGGDPRDKELLKQLEKEGHR